ncbi:MAG: hypothetical protein QGG64_07770 [Candidatus Latescibacteria bacterium]|jgi:hypothetical protein|nr:hypothetical protein [Candidatus Latescibacterota bacterium]
MFTLEYDVIQHTASGFNRDNSLFLQCIMMMNFRQFVKRAFADRLPISSALDVDNKNGANKKPLEDFPAALMIYPA